MGKNVVLALLSLAASAVGLESVYAQQSVTIVDPLPCFVTTAAPTYLTGFPGKCSMTTAGAIRVDASGTAIQGGTIGSAPNGGANNIQIAGKDTSGNLAHWSLDPCQIQVHNYTPINIVTATTFQIATPTSAKKNYLCYMLLYAGGADNVGVIEGSSSSCTGGTVAGVMGGSTAATGFTLIANQGIPFGTGSNAIAVNSVANQSICLITSAAVQLSGVAVWVTQ